MLLPLLLIAACTKDVDPTDSADTEAVAEDCTDGSDNDGDALVDCADPDCAATCLEKCDGLDGDQDGLFDCDDPDCYGSACAEICTDGVDNDGDGLLDCEDADCLAECAEQDCTDGLDNDADGFFDCRDSDCFSEDCGEVCEDGSDNDVDGLVDCLDPDCFSPDCSELCEDGNDNDADGLIDCLDADCFSEDCAEDCADAADNDADGLADCADPDCFSAACPEDCWDGLDNDDDGLLDCEDGDCNSECTESACGDRLDNDRDGLLDCEDDDCLSSESCLPEKEVWITSGNMYRHMTGRLVVPSYPSTSQSSVATMTNISGRVRYAAGSGHLSTTASVVSCDFHINTWITTWTAGRRWGSYGFISLGGLQTSGLSVESPCTGLPGSEFLPDYDRSGLSASQTRWGLFRNKLVYSASYGSGAYLLGTPWFTGSEIISSNRTKFWDTSYLVSSTWNRIYSGEVSGLNSFTWEPPLSP
jgi:hypothetical protein